MTRIRTATIFGTLSLSLYISVACIAAIVIGPAAVRIFLMPIWLFEGLYGGIFGSDVLSVFSLWLTFAYVADLSVRIASIDLRQSGRLLSSAADGFAKRLRLGLRVS